MNALRFIKENKAFAVIFAVAALTRLLPLGSYQFSYDELSALSRTTYGSWRDLISYGATIDAHPVLIQCFLYAWTGIVGYSEPLVKLPFILMSLGGILYAYAFSLRWFGRLPAILTALIFSFSFIFMYYAPLARMYTSGIFFTCGFTYYWFIVLFDENARTRHFAWMSVFILLCALNAHMSCLYVLICGITGLLIVKKERLLNYLLFCALAVVLYLPHLGITFFQLDYGGIGAGQKGWLAVPHRLVLFSFLKTLLGTGYIWMFFTMGFITAFALNMDLMNRKAGLLLVIFLVNYGIIHAYSVFKAPIFQYSVMMFSAPCFVWAFTSFFRFTDRWAVVTAALAAGVLAWQTFVQKDFYKNCAGNQNAYVYHKVKELQEKYGSQKVDAVFFDTEKIFMLLYEVQDKHRIRYRIGDEVASLKTFAEFLRNSKADYLVLGNTEVLQFEMAKDHFPYIVETLQNPHINYCLLSRKATDKKLDTFFATVDSSAFFNPSGYEYRLDPGLVTANQGRFSYRVDSLNLYPVTVQAPFYKISSKEGQVILASATTESGGPLKDVGLHFSVSDRKDSILHFTGTELSDFYAGQPGSKVYSALYLGSDYRTWRSQALLKCFFWNRGRKQFAINDLRMRTIDYWPAKWSLWE